MRQLFHLGVIEPFSGSLKRNKDVEELKPYDVAVSPELLDQVVDCLKSLDMPPVQVGISSSLLFLKSALVLS